MLYEDDIAKFHHRLSNEFQNMKWRPSEYQELDNLRTFIELTAKAGFTLDALLKLISTKGITEMANIVFAKINASQKPPGSTDGNSSG